MITKEFLIDIGFEADDANFILLNNNKYINEIAPIVKEYMTGLNIQPFVQYKGAGREQAIARADWFIKQVQDKIPYENKYVLNLLAWLNCIPYLYQNHKKFCIDDVYFYEAMKDFSYKARECKNVYGVCGLFVNWFFLFFELKEVSLGRLQYEVTEFGYDEYVYENVSLKKGDRVYSCHIPSSGKLTYEMCMDSFQKAYDFFKPHISGDIIPIICRSWLLYKPYNDNVFPENSNLKRFAGLFDITDVISSGNVFNDGWRVFDKMYEGTAKHLPSDNTLRRNFINYINSGGDFGCGYGIILYNGKTNKIININKKGVRK